MLETPVVFIIFRRPELTQRVFNEIARVQPKYLYVIADGARNDDDVVLVEQTRAIIEQVDWDCKVYKNFAEKNLGLRERISSGLDWVFEQTETAIILEDDCLPHPTFFRFCEVLLDYYQNNNRVMHISGDNFGYKRAQGVEDSYYFSRYAHVWGWATWRRAWAKYDVHMTSWQDDQDDVISKFERRLDQKYWYKHWDVTYKKENRTWDYQWIYACVKHDGLCVMPYENQISNIGMGNASTNTHDANSPLANLATKTIEFPLSHPSVIMHNSSAERKVANLFWMSQVSLRHRIWAKLKKIISR